MEITISQSKTVRLSWNKKQTYWLNSRPQMWPSDITLTLNFEGQRWNLLYLSQKWFDCHGTKATISNELSTPNWLMGLTLTMTLTLNFHGQYGNCCISGKNNQVAKKWKASVSIEHLTSNVGISFNLGHDLDLGFSWSKFKSWISGMAGLIDVKHQCDLDL